MLRGATIVAFLAATTAQAMAEDWARAGSNREEKDGQELTVTYGGDVTSDYRLRGISLSDRYPSVGAFVDVERSLFFVSAAANSVRLPTAPAAETIFAAGVRPRFGPVDLEFQSAYYLYPGEIGDRTSYFEGSARASAELAKNLTVGGTLAYAPNIWNSGAAGTYAAIDVKVDLPRTFLPSGFDWFVLATVGHSWLGTARGGIDLPDYTHWQVGLTFRREALSFNLSYHDTNLSRANCAMLMSDRGFARDSLQSDRCGAGLVGTLSFELTSTLPH